MPPAIACIARLPVTTLGDRRRAGWGVLVALHLVAAGILLWSEGDLICQFAFVLAWGLWNFTFLLILRRPIVAAALSLLLLIVLVLLSQLKYQALFQTVSFIDVMIIDLNTIRFLFAIYPTLTQTVAVIAPVMALLVIAFWWLDRLRLPRRIALAGCAICLGGLGALGYWQPLEPSQAFYGGNFLSSFARSGVDAVVEFATRGYMESDPVASDRLKAMDQETCKPAHKPPHIIMVHDESSFDIRMLPGIKVPDGYGAHFRSYDGKERRLLVEGAGGPSWYTEFNVFAGLSSRSFGRFAYFVTRISAGRVKRGLPLSLRHCGYRTYSLYPWLGAFMLDPAVTLLQGKNKDLVILSDTRTQKDTLAVFGGEYPGGALYTKSGWIASHPKETQALTSAIVATLKWIHSHTPEEIMAKMPDNLIGPDKALYLAALKNTIPMYSTTGRMSTYPMTPRPSPAARATSSRCFSTC